MTAAAVARSIDDSGLPAESILHGFDVINATCKGETLMAADHPPLELMNFIIGDFEAAWDALALRPEDNLPRGNYTFARQAMMLLEFACRLCMSDATDQSLADFSVELFRRDWRYFIRLPGICPTPGDFKLPQHGPYPESQFIAALFDLIRNGQAHQYQQIRARLAGGDFGFALTGAVYGLPLRQTFANGRPSDHFEASRCPNGDIRMIIRTDALFLDLRDSARGARLGSRVCLQSL
jgi:hypothetical protein